VPDLQEELHYHLLAYGMVAAAAATLAFCSWALSRRGPWLPLQRARRVDWDGGQVTFAFLAMILLPSIVEAGLLARGFFHMIYGQEPSSIRQHLWSNLISFPFIIATILVTLYLSRGTRPSDLGLTRARLLRNVTLGGSAWFPLTVATLAVHFVVLHLIQAEDHPLVDLVKEGLLPWEWTLIVAEALAAAPFLEELLFRGVLQGWLSRCSRSGHIAVMVATLLVAGLPYFFAGPNKEPEPAPLLFALFLVPGYLLTVLRHGPTAVFTPREPEPPLPQTADSIRAGAPPVFDYNGIQLRNQATHALLFNPPRRFPLPAIFGSSMLWAVFHSSVWPSPIALFLLGLGLGWLTYRTQSLGSSLLVHVLFNGVAFLVLVLQQ